MALHGGDSRTSKEGFCWLSCYSHLPMRKCAGLSVTLSCKSSPGPRRALWLAAFEQVQRRSFSAFCALLPHTLPHER